jgi:mono/diheme cytochrome c family protein
MKRRQALVAAGAGAVLLVGAAFALPAVRLYWRVHSSNSVRRGLEVATHAGCFSCHGPMGTSGIPDPNLGEDVPPWSGGVFMMYVKHDDEVREYVLDGVSGRQAQSQSARARRERAAIRMPAFRDTLSSREVDDVVAAFLALSGMKRPVEGTPEARGLEIAEKHRCLSCHAPGGSGGRPNPGSFTGFVPGWYGADFRDLTRGRTEFVAWVREGKIERLSDNLAARLFIRRQRIQMPAYADMSADDLDALWAYVSWLGVTRGGLDAPSASF